ncbi:hypothetical protein PHISCL_02564 [Aspergillus sclerotialis]|uniref:Uncharacterized protein n=1 Tax=Aspergillus sclerotialis TaxID=2070753 RepID=A0A3A2ZRZ2_9EURO|nr:hypothetical protein PHISCL_02564 [Aspergillus sclerotialis]
MPFSRSENAIQCPGAPKANGNYALVIKHGNVLHLSGWMGQDPETGKVVEGGAVAQTEQAVRNIETCLLAAGSSLDKVISRRIFTTDMSKVFEVDDAWGRLLKPPYPVSTAIGISSLTQEGAIVELEVTAAID